MIINNFTFEESVIKPKVNRNKIATIELLLSNDGEEIAIGDYDPKQLIEWMPHHITTTGQCVLSKLLNCNLSDECLRKILRILVEWENDKNVELSNLYTLLFNQPICKAVKIDDFTFNTEELTSIVNQLIISFQQAINSNPDMIENITAWTSLLIDNNRLLMPIKETTKLLELIKQYQQFQQSIRNIKLLISQTPIQVKKQNKVTHVYF